MPSSNNERATIEDIREAIDVADGAILKSLGARMRLIEFLRRLKKLTGGPIEDRVREAAVKQRWKTLAKEEGVREELALLILDFLLSESKRIQSE